jgi:hypothetical protein
MKITSSLVVYNNDSEILLQTLTSLFNTPLPIQLYVVDNSPSPELKDFFDSFKNVNYYFNNGDNCGFGKAHNIAMEKVEKADYHLVLNPDVYFESNVIPELIKYLEEHQDVGLVVPKVNFPSGETQYLCKRYPNVLVLFARRLIPKKFQFMLQKSLDYYEMKDLSYDKPVEVPIVSGCFMLFRRKYLDEVGYFDEKMFMYFEDFDLSIRFSQKYKVILYPLVNIYHHWARDAHKKLSLTIVFIKSATYFFNKHGWKLF